MWPFGVGCRNPTQHVSQNLSMQYLHPVSDIQQRRFAKITLSLSKFFLGSWNSVGLFSAATERYRGEQRPAEGRVSIAGLPCACWAMHSLEVTASTGLQATKAGRPGGCQLLRSHRRQRKAELRPEPGRAAEAGFATREVVEAGHAKFLRKQGGC